MDLRPVGMRLCMSTPRIAVSIRGVERRIDRGWRRLGDSL